MGMLVLFIRVAFILSATTTAIYLSLKGFSLIRLHQHSKNQSKKIYEIRYKRKDKNHLFQTEDLTVFKDVTELLRKDPEVSKLEK